MASQAISSVRPKIGPLTHIIDSRPRIALTLTPTAIHHLPRLSKMLGTSIFCKRDDLTGIGYSGNKARKLEYLIKDALDKGAKTIVTCGSRQSNWCRMTAVAGAVADLTVHLVLGGGKPSEMTGNLKLDELVGANLHFIDADDDALLEHAAEDLTEALAELGHNPLRIPMGGSTGLGALGYVDAFREILEFEERHSLQFSAIVVATGSGGTQAGLVAGQTLSGWAGEIIGMSASRIERAQTEQVRKVLSQIDTIAHTDVSGAKIVTNDSYVGDGYRIPTAGCQEAIEIFARTEGIFLDEVYAGKAAAGLIDYARKGRFDKSHRVLFLHTGGTAQLFER